MIKGTYVGRGENGKPHGFGILTNGNDKVYANWVNGIAEGRVIYQNGKNIYFTERAGGRYNGYWIAYYEGGNR